MRARVTRIVVNLSEEASEAVDAKIWIGNNLIGTIEKIVSKYT